jgi:hypothetical protein
MVRLAGPGFAVSLYIKKMSSFNAGCPIFANWSPVKVLFDDTIMKTVSPERQVINQYDKYSLIVSR